MTASATYEVYYDPWRADLNADPYPMFKRSRDEAPLYYNEIHDFDALSHITRAPRQHLTFGVGADHCLRNALARVEGRIALDEILNRLRDWEVDLDNAIFSSSSAVRGWDSMPARV